MSTVLGAKQLIKQLDTLARKVQPEQLDDALFEGAQVFEQAARSLARRRTGRMAESIYSKSLKHSSYKAVFSGHKQGPVKPGTSEVRVAAFYGPFVEFGTRRGVRAQPFMRPAFDTKRQEAVEVVDRTLHGVVEHTFK